MAETARSEQTSDRIPEWTLGERLAKARRESGWTQAEMAGLLEVSPGAVANWESGHSQPRTFLETMRGWSELTGVSLGWLLGLTANTSCYWGTDPERMAEFTREVREGWGDLADQQRVA